MKKILTGALVFVAILCAQNSMAQNSSEVFMPTTVDDENWVLVENNNGIKISLLELEERGNRFVEVLFENVQSNDVEFAWTLSNKNNEVLINSTAQIKANGSYINYDTNRMVKLKQNETIADFKVEIK